MRSLRGVGDQLYQGADLTSETAENPNCPEFLGRDLQRGLSWATPITRPGILPTTKRVSGYRPTVVISNGIGTAQSQCDPRTARASFIFPSFYFKKATTLNISKIPPQKNLFQFNLKNKKIASSYVASWMKIGHPPRLGTAPHFCDKWGSYSPRAPSCPLGGERREQ